MADDGANSTICCACATTQHSSFSPLLLCDVCPKAFHMHCLGLSWQDLPHGDWACPKCRPRPCSDQQDCRPESLDRLVVSERRRQERIRNAFAGAERECQRASEPAQREPRSNARRGGRLAPAAADLAREQAIGGGDNQGHAAEQYREAADRLRRLPPATAAGPPGLQHVISGERELLSLMDALAVSEFLAAFGGLFGAPSLNLGQLLAAAAWPLDGPELFDVYNSLVKYLLAQWSHIEAGHVGARVRRWARCMERSSMIGRAGRAPNGNATWQELLRRYCLLSRSSLRVSVAELGGGAEWAAMSDDLIMVHAAVELGKQAAWTLGPEFHLRLLHALCNDMVNCYNIKAEISSRLDSNTTLQADRFHAGAEERRREREVARLRRDAASAARDKRAREIMFHGGCEAGSTSANDSSSFLAASEPLRKRARSSGGSESDDCDASGWADDSSWDADAGGFAAELMHHAIRTEPLGMDRRHQRYWHLQSDRSVIFVESADGAQLGLISSTAQLDALMLSLNRRGACEGALYAALQEHYSELCHSLGSVHVPLDVRGVPRRCRPGCSWLDKAHASLPASVALDERGWPVGRQPSAANARSRGTPPQNPTELLGAASEATAVAAALSELEVLVSQLVGVGVPDLNAKHWRARLRGRKTVDELCGVLEELEAVLSGLGDGRPAGARAQVIQACAAEADAFEAEFVLPVSAAELAEQREAAAAAAAAANQQGRESGEAADAPEQPGAEAAAGQASGPGRSSSSSKSKKGGKKNKGSFSKKSKKAGEEAEDDTNPDAGAHRGPHVLLLSGATRVRKASAASQAAAASAVQQVKAAGLAADGAGGGAGGGVRMVCPLEELDDSDVEAEKRYQEKRAAEKAGEPLPPPPVVLWRSMREMGVWFRDLRRARTSGALGGAAYAAAALADRGYRFMSALALSRIRTGVAAVIADDRHTAVLRKQELLLGPSPAAESLALPNAPATAAVSVPPLVLTSTGRRIKSAGADPAQHLAPPRHRSRRGAGRGSEEDGGEGTPEQDQLDDEEPPLAQGKWELACLVCGRGGDVACCEVPGCGVLMHLTCTSLPESDEFYCPDHVLGLQPSWCHSVAPPGLYQQQPPPPVRPWG